MSLLNQNPNALPHASPGPAPVLERVLPSPVAGAAPFSQPFIPQSGGPSEPPTFNFQVRRSLRMHRKLAVLVGLAVCLLLVALGLMQPRTYTASSVIYVEPMVARNLNEQGVPGFDQFRYGSFLDQQMQTIVRPDVLTAALRTLPPGTWAGPRESEQSAVARLAKALTVERALTSYQITIQLKASDPQAAAAIVNAVTKAYLQRGREDEFKQADLREQILSEERDRVKQELDTDRKEQAALGASMGLASPADGAGNPYDADLAGLRAQLATAREARDVAAAQLASVTGPDADHHSGLTASADDLINSDPGLSAKKAAVNARRVVLESMMAGMTPSNPQYRQAQDEIADLDRALEAKTAEVRAQTERRIQDKLRTDLQRTADVESKLNAQLAQATAKATGAGPKLQRAAELANDIQRLTARYTTVDEALNALEVETSGPGMAHVPLPAAVPLLPDPNHRDLFFIAALPLGMLCGVAAAVLARRSDRRVYLGSDLQQVLGFAPIAVLPARSDVSDRVIEEYVLRLAAGVESAYRTAGAQSFVVTAVSADTETGTLLVALSHKLQELWLRVAVIKSSELLIPSPEAVEHQGVGRRTIQAGEGIGSANLDGMKCQHDIILIDAAPLLHSAETEYAARCADATILVVESAITQTTELTAATALLSRLRVSGVGAVLDQLKLEHADESFRSAVRIIEQRSFEGAVAPAPVEPVAATPASEPTALLSTAPAEPIPWHTEPVQPAPVTATADTAPSSRPPRPLSPAADVQAAPAPAAVKPVIPDVPASAASSILPGPEPQAVEALTVQPTDVVLAPHTPRRSFKTWTAQPAISPEEAEPLIPRPPVRERFELLGELAHTAAFEGPVAVSASGTNGNAPHAVAIAPLDGNPPAPPESPRAALRAASAKLQMGTPISAREGQRPGDDSIPSEDPLAVGRFVGDRDKVGAVPSYTRSKIRLAFKEQEVNSKTTWFSKLFRGDPPSNFKIIPDEAEGDYESPETPELQQEQLAARIPEATADGDPELSHLLSRIRTSGQTTIAPRTRPVAVESESSPAGSAVPFVERRSEPRPVEMDEDRAPSPVASTPQAPVRPPGIPAPLTPPLAPAPVSFAAPPASPAPSSPGFVPPRSVRPQPEPTPAPYGRPLRPLTFQQLAGHLHDEAPHQEPQQPAEPVDTPVPDVLEPPVSASVPAAPVAETGAEPPMQKAVAPPVVSTWELPPILREAAPKRVAPPTPAPALPMISHSGMPLWPSKEPISNPDTPSNQSAKPTPASKSEPVPIHTAPDFKAVVNEPEPALSPEQSSEASVYLAPSPSARRGSFERIPILPDPLTDPSPTQRPYRLENAPSAVERPVASPSSSPSASEPEASAPIATAPAVTSFPPDHEARRQLWGRRKTDRIGADGKVEVPGLTRRWKLLSQFEPVVTDPLPAHRKGYTRSTDFNPPKRSDEG